MRSLEFITVYADRVASIALRLEEELHFDARQFDDVVIVQRASLRIECSAMDAGEEIAFNMGDEIACGRLVITAT